MKIKDDEALRARLAVAYCIGAEVQCLSLPYCWRSGDVPSKMLAAEVLVCYCSPRAPLQVPLDRFERDWTNLRPSQSPSDAAGVVAAWDTKSDREARSNAGVGFDPEVSSVVIALVSILLALYSGLFDPHCLDELLVVCRCYCDVQTCS